MTQVLSVTLALFLTCSNVMAKSTDIPYEKWVAAIEKSVKPQFIEINKKAFDLGYNF